MTLKHKNETNAQTTSNRVSKLREIIDRLKPHLDSSGVACCFLQAVSGRSGARQPLISKAVKDYLLYVFQTEEGESAPRRDIERAVSEAHGRLWHQRASAERSFHPVTLLIQKLADGAESWVGTSTEFLSALEEVNGNNADGLPRNAASLGVLLTKLILECNDVGVDLYRPSRRAKQRLWAWRRLPSDDSNDNLMTAPTDASCGPESALPASDEDDSDDALSEFELEIQSIYQEPEVKDESQ